MGISNNKEYLEVNNFMVVLFSRYREDTKKYLTKSKNNIVLILPPGITDYTKYMTSFGECVSFYNKDGQKIVWEAPMKNGLYKL